MAEYDYLMLDDRRGEARLLLLTILNLVDRLTDEEFDTLLDDLAHIGVRHLWPDRPISSDPGLH